MGFNQMNWRVRTTAWVLVAAMAFTGCSTKRYKEKADLEAYSLIAEKAEDVPGMSNDVDIEPPDAISLEDLPKNTETYDFLGDAAESEVGASIINLDQALEIAFRHSRDYQNQKERLYLQALSLSIQRHRFAPIFTGSASGERTWERGDGFRDSVSGLTRFGVSKLMRTGGAVALNLSSNFFEFLEGPSEDSASSMLVGSVTQPLLRGGGRKVAMENLTQAEQNLLYQLRDFTRFRKEFAVRIASVYYGVLQNKDAVYNNYLGLESQILSLKRERAFQQEGLRTPGQVGLLEQSKLSRESSWISSINRYQQALDEFKILLGISTDALITLDGSDLESLQDADLTMPNLSLDEAIDVALVSRLDLYTNIDQVQDAERRIVVANNGMLPQLDIEFTSSTPSKDGNRFTALDFSETQITGGFFLDIPFDRKAERNNYRAALIDLEVARRSAALSIDNVKLNVRQAFRNLEQAQRDFEIDLASVELNVARVEEEELKAELGLGSIRDQVDAQNALTNAQTALTGTLVRQRIALLEFWRDIGALYIQDNGHWEEDFDV